MIVTKIFLSILLLYNLLVLPTQTAPGDVNDVLYPDGKALKKQSEIVDIKVQAMSNILYFYKGDNCKYLRSYTLLLS